MSDGVPSLMSVFSLLNCKVLSLLSWAISQLGVHVPSPLSMVFSLLKMV
jgi:hypothetical protein